ncbi:enoyl-CoA hydratase/isomerase family protein [Ectothiorhodospiraceae bacterium WFHF3C12]|nr:enoyl-CoA hydratase/isomerase family protein [Ectothiorhodospiraceae bacterium WFHF3C12]
MSDPVEYEKHDRIAYITLNRPKALNALDESLGAALAEVWADFAADDTVDVAILHGAGKAFCAGADVKSFIPRWENASFGDLRRNAAFGLAGGITRGRHRLYKPIIAALHGHAVGAGFELALACDIRIAASDTTLGVFEVRIGLHQGDGGLVRLVNIAGMGTALDLSLTGRPVDAQEALRLGLVQRVVEPGDLLSAAEEAARQILANSQPAVRSAKETVMELVGRPLDDALRLEALYGYSSFGEFANVRNRLDAMR